MASGRDQETRLSGRARFSSPWAEASAPDTAGGTSIAQNRRRSAVVEEGASVIGPVAARSRRLRSRNLNSRSASNDIRRRSSRQPVARGPRSLGTRPRHRHGARRLRLRLRFPGSHGREGKQHGSRSDEINATHGLVDDETGFNTTERTSASSRFSGPSGRIRMRLIPAASLSLPADCSLNFS